MQYISVILNMFMVILLVRICSAPDQETFFNPFVSFTNSRLNKLIEFLKPALALPEKATLAIILIFLFFFKSLLISRLKLETGISFGEVFRVLPPEGMPEHISLLLFSLLGTISFILKFWSFYFLISLIGTTGKNSRASQAVRFYAKPFSVLPFHFQPFILLGAHVILAFIAVNTGNLISTPIGGKGIETATNPIAAAPLIIGMIKTVWVGLLAFCEGLSAMISVLFTFIIGSLVATLMQKPNIAMLCREGMDLVLGRFSRGRTPQAGLDFTPLIFFFVVSISYNTVNYVILSLVNTQFQLPF